MYNVACVDTVFVDGELEIMQMPIVKGVAEPPGQTVPLTHSQ